MPPFERNKLEFPKSVDDNVAFLKAWQEMFDGDSFDFDYHRMWDHSNDPGHMQISRTIAGDMKGLAKIGLNGYVSCQIQRIFLPTGLAMTAMVQTLWNAAADCDILADDYFASAFGTDGAACRDYLERLTELFDPVYIRGEKGWADPEQAQRFAKVPGLIQSFMPVIDARKSEVFCRLYAPDGNPLTSPMNLRPANLGEIVSDETLFIGNGVELYREVLSRTLGTRFQEGPEHLWHPRASVLGRMALLHVSRGEYRPAQPLYVRPSDAALAPERMKPGEQR